VAMPNMNGIEAAQVISRMSPSPRIVVLTMFDSGPRSRCNLLCF
jgi:DNA-binding NarL/FixJ family response regulator